MFHNAADLFDRKGPEIGTLGQVLADESVGVLVEPTLPRMVGVGKVALCVEFFGDGLMIGELLAVVIGEGVNKVGMRPQCYEQGIRDGLSGLVGSLGDDANVSCALQREQDGVAQLSDHGVGLPVADAGAFLNDLCHSSIETWPLIWPRRSLLP